MKMVNIEATTIEDAWFQCVSAILEHGDKYVIQHGSYIGQERLEFDWIVVDIKNPYQEPYDLMLPQIPAALNIPNPVENGYIEQYLPYLMTDVFAEDEVYTYGHRLNASIEAYPTRTSMLHVWNKGQVDYFINLLKKTPNTNQAILQVGRPEDCLLEDPPCLRHVDLRIKDNQLVFYPYFRSNDLWNGFPANLAGLAVLQKYMADEIGVGVGHMIYSSKGLHLYDYVEELAKIRVNRC